MLKLRKRYEDAKVSAVELMEAGNINAYIAKLSEIEQIEVQMLNMALFIGR